MTMDTIQAQLKTLTLAPTNQTSPKRNYYCLSYSINFIHGSKNCSLRKSCNQDETYKKGLGGSNKGCKWQLGATTNKIKISHPKISLIHCINTPPNTPSNIMLEIADSGANIHLSKKSTTKTALVIMSTEMATRLPEGSKMESSRIVTLQQPGLSKQVRQIHILPKIKTAPLISLGVLCDDGYTITLDRVQPNTSPKISFSGMYRYTFIYLMNRNNSQ